MLGMNYYSKFIKYIVRSNSIIFNSNKLFPQLQQKCFRSITQPKALTVLFLCDIVSSIIHLKYYLLNQHLSAMYAPVRNALELVGNKHKYQYLITLLLFCFNYFANFISIGGTLIFMNPSFRCSFSPDIIDESLACQRISECEITSDYTIVASMELYCDQQFQRNAVQSVSAIGSIIGLLIINYISDHKGRKVSILILQIVAILGFAITIIGAEYKYIILLLIGQFLCGFSSYSMVLSTYILPSQFCQEIFRQRAVVAVNYAWSLTFILLGILYYFCNYWRVFLLYFCLIPLIVVCIITYFFMVQGPNYLYSQNKIQQCRDSLKFIAKINGRQVQYEQAEKLIVHRELEDHQKNSIFQAVRILLKNKKYIKLLLVLTALQFGGNTYYYGGNYALDLIGYELGTNLIAAGIIQILGFATLNMVIEKVPRKKAIIICYTILASLGFLFIIPEVRESLTGQAVILGIARYLITMAYLTIIITLTESFPMKVQSICSGFVQSLAQLGIFAGPIVVILCINLQIYPLIVFSGILVIFVVIPAFGLEQTLRNEKQKTQLGLLVDQKEGQQ